MAPTKPTKFNFRWLDQTQYPDFADWLNAVPNDIHSAHCKSCKKNFSLSNMGIGAIKYHARGSEHCSIIKHHASQSSVKTFFSSLSSTATHSSTTGSQEIASSSSDSALNEQKSSSATSVPPKEITLQQFVTNDEVLRSEVLWALNVVEKKMSLNSCTNISRIFKKMFTDSVIAQKFQLGKDKVSYIIHYGISYYFQENLLEMIKECSDVTICFDESLNKIVQKGQMDLFIKFWNREKVNTRYLGSCFLGHATAQDLLENFLKALDPIPLQKLLHVSMDGPNVNLSFLKKLEEKMFDENPDGKCLIQMGTCGLHVIHGAIKTGLKAVDWDLFTLLRNLYYLFKDSPARRAEFTKITGCKKFPMKFCAVRWLENSVCIERAIEIVDSVKQYLAEVKRLETKVQSMLQKSLSDPILKCRLAFFRSLSLHCETFLTKFQSDSVVVPYLHSELSILLGGIIKKFVKSDKNLEGSALLKLDIKSTNNLLDLKKIDIGFNAKKFLKEIKVADKVIQSFYLDCRKILQTVAQKIIEKSPLKYKIVRGLSSLHPSVILNNPDTGANRFNAVLEKLHDTNRISETVAENAKLQYSSFCTVVKESYKDEFEKFLSDESDLELDAFYHKYLSVGKKWEDLWAVIKLCFLLSHGNAAVEKGFSINKTILVENLQEESLVNQRRVFDGIKALGGAENIEINNKMLLAVRAARQRYRQDLERKKMVSEIVESKAVEKRKIRTELQELESKKKKIRLEREREEMEMNQKIQLLEEKRKSLT